MHTDEAPTSDDPSEVTDGHAPLPLPYQKQAVLDVAQRMRNGLLVYPAIWMVLTLVDGYVLRHTQFVLINGLCMLALTTGRLIYHRRLKQSLDRDFARTQFIFRSMSLGYNLYWGILCAILLTAPDAPNLGWMMLMSTVGITAGGTVIVAIDSLLPVLYPLCTLGPTVMALLPAGGATNYGIAGLATVLFAYSVGISRLVSSEYWARQREQALLEQRARELEAISRTDALTQVPNRLKFQEGLLQAWRDARRRKEPLALAMVDLDHFKKINDTHGHPFGDRCLQAAAQSLSRAVHRPGDLVCRYGGEEFVILMPNTDLEGARLVAERMLAHIADTVVSQDGRVVILSCSIGVAISRPTLSSSAETLVQEADAALYYAKQNGRAQVACQPDIPHAGPRLVVGHSA